MESGGRQARYSDPLSHEKFAQPFHIDGVLFEPAHPARAPVRIQRDSYHRDIPSHAGAYPPRQFRDTRDPQDADGPPVIEPAEEAPELRVPPDVRVDPGLSK
jgi:hypothetical protein